VPKSPGVLACDAKRRRCTFRASLDGVCEKSTALASGAVMADLDQLAHILDGDGRLQRFVEDDALLEWAEENALSPGSAQLEALRRGIIPSRYVRNLCALTLEEQQRLCGSTALVCGCGGLGGILVELLARAGVGRMRIVDGDVFVPSNLNRQLFSDRTSLARAKADVAAEALRIINPFTSADAIRENLTETNAERLVQGTDLVMDALDNIEGRRLLATTARRLEVPLIHAAVAGWWGQVSTLLPGGSIDLDSIYGTQQSRDVTEQSFGVLGPVAATIGSLQALEAVRILCGRPSAYNDRLLYFDGESGRMEVMPLESASFG
jgi:molybdopterin-synthase adenylyltransferase